MSRLVGKVLGDRESLARFESYPPNGKTHGVSSGGGYHGQGVLSYFYSLCAKIGRPVGLPFYGWPSRLYWPKSFKEPLWTPEQKKFRTT